MIVIHADSPGDSRRLARALGGTGTLVVEDNVRLRAVLREADCLLFSRRGSRLADRIEELAHISSSFPSLPIILITDRGPDVALPLAAIRLSAVVWRDSLETDLPLAAQTARRTSALEAMARRIEASDLPPALLHALPLAVRRAATRPFRKPRDLANGVARSPVTLSQEFGACCPICTLGDFLSGLQLLRASHLRATGMSWRAAANDLGFSRDALRRKAKRWPGCTLKDLATRPPRQLLRDFTSDRVRPLVRPEP